MSQAIRKLEKGNKVEQQQEEKLFKDGNRNISLNLIQKNANQNVQNYIDSKGWSKRKKQAFMDAYSDMMTSIDNGNIQSRDLGRKYIDSSGRIKNQEGKGFDAYGEAAHFLDTIVDVMPDYEGSTTKKDKYDQSGLMTYFKNKTFGGNDPDLIAWQDRDMIDNNTGKRGITNRANYFADVIKDYSQSISDKDYDFEGSAYSDKNDLLNRLKVAEDSLRNGDFNNDDFNALTALGIDGDTARMLFSEDSYKSKENPSESEQYLMDAEQKRKQEELDKKVEILKQDEKLREQLTQEYITPAQGFTRRELSLPRVNYDPINWGKLLEEAGPEGQSKFYQELENYLVNSNPFDNQNLNVYNSVLKSNVPYLPHIANTLYTLKDKVGKDAGNGYYYLPYTINKNNGTVLLYNPDTNQLVQEAIYKVPNLWNEIQNSRRAEYTGSTFNFGEGGIIKFQNGGYYSTQNLDFVMDDYRRYKAEQNDKKESEVKESAKKNNRTVEQEKAGQQKVDEWSGVEWSRLGAAAADAASIVAAFVPGYGTAASAGLGLGSTITNLGADIADDSVSAGEAAWNAISGLGMDVVGLIPGFGAAGKSSKIAKNLIKLTPKILTLWGTSQAFAPAVDALKKLISDEKLTVDDWKALSAGLSATAGLSRMGLASFKTKQMKNATKTKDKTIQVKSGETKRITDTQLENLKKAGNLEEANNILKKIKGFENEELEYSFNRGKNPFKKQFYYTPRVGDYYDFDTYHKSGRKFGERVDEKIYQGMVNSSIPRLNITLPKWFNFTNPYSKDYKPKPKTESKSKKLLNSPRYYRLKSKGFTEEQLRNKGIYKEGGQIIKAQEGTNTSRFSESFMRDYKPLITTVSSEKEKYGKVRRGKGYSFDTKSRLTSVLDLLKNNKLTLDDVSMMQRRHAGMYSTYNPEWSPVYNDLVKQYQNDYQNLGLNDLVIQPNYTTNYQVMSSNPNSGDRAKTWTADGRYDAITDDRRILARKEDYINPDGTVNQELLNKDISTAKASGYNYYLDADSGYYMLSKIKPEVPQPSIAKANKTPEPTGTEGSQSASPSKWVEAFEEQVPNFIGVGRLAGNIWNNNRVTKEALAGLKPLRLDTYNLYRATVGDLPTKTAFYNKASQLENLAFRPRTSDASLQLAGELEAVNRGNELRTQGDLADAQRIGESGEQSYLTESDNIARRTDVMNRNRASDIGIDKAKRDMIAAKKSANWVSMENFLKDLEYKSLNKQDQQRQFGMQLAQNNLYNKYFNNPRYLTLRDQAMKEGATPEQLNNFQTYSEQVGRQYQDELNREYAKVYGLKYRNRYSPVYSRRNGGSIPVARIKARTESAKLFQENIQNTVKNHLKMIDNLSSVTKELIIKSMTI